MQNERIRECAIVGVPDEVLGERVHAFIVPEGKPMTFAELREWAKERIADYKIPETMTLLTDPLPRNASGKILKSELKSRLTAKS
jgi:long-chain acyl-CoA synthetase